MEAITKVEAKDLATYAHKIADALPRGFSDLSDALTFAGTDLIAYYRYNRQLSGFHKATSFIKGIPKFEDLEGPQFLTWISTDKSHLKYWQ